MVGLKATKKQRTPIGVDLGARGVRAAQLAREGTGWSVVATGACDRPPAQAEDDAGPVPAPIVRMVTTPERFRGSRTVAAMNSPDVDYFSLELPEALLRAADGRLDQIVAAEVSRLMGRDEADAVSGYWKSPPGKPPSPNVVGVGTAPGVVRRLLQTLDAARLLCSVVEPGALALARLGAVIRRPAPDELWGILDLGERQSRLILCVGVKVVLARPAGVGVRDWTRRVCDALQVSEKSAEVHLREHGIARVGGRNENEGPTRRDSLSGLMTGALRAHLRSIASEAQRSIAYAKQCYPDRAFSGLIAVGGGSLVPNVPAYLEHSLGVDVRGAGACLQSERCQLTYHSGHARPLELIGLAIGSALPADELNGTA